jgi:2-polyprenyl-3-methyl-5-hydroxy-6-metoxy-1,4-benzoquinol methylase
MVKPIYKTDSPQNNKLVRDAVLFAISCKPDACTIVDIGSRTGYAVELFCDRGFDAIGTDVTKEHIEYAVSKSRNVIYDDILDTKLTQEYDLVFSRHALEHCKDTLLFLNNCYKLLNPSGVAVIIFPLETAHKDSPYEHGEHCVFYPTTKDFEAVVKQTKFRIHSITRQVVHNRPNCYFVGSR